MAAFCGCVKRCEGCGSCSWALPWPSHTAPKPSSWRDQHSGINLGVGSLIPAGGSSEVKEANPDKECSEGSEFQPAQCLFFHPSLPLGMAAGGLAALAVGNFLEKCNNALSSSLEGVRNREFHSGGAHGNLTPLLFHSVRCIQQEKTAEGKKKTGKKIKRSSSWNIFRY